ncbi:hypothetical protein [Deinococcus sp.]|uniref:hypothetical protein n=1 Tax=Deinococcus sp. TaxID=47478 RepID=UPI0025B8573D|nr:hypothetical protein [Deinococcus sp.]
MIIGGLFLLGTLLFILSAVLGGDTLSRVPGFLSLITLAVAGTLGLMGLGRAVGIASLLLGGVVAALLFGWL